LIRPKYFGFILILIAATILIGCGTNSIKQFDTPPGADPSVPAELGGEGFTGDGWMTKADYNILGDSNAVKGGTLNMYVPDFPGTLRTEGKDANSYLNRMIQRMVYETLLSQDPVTEEFIPSLATHWKISEDHMEFQFRINPNARWADGKPVTSEDVIATWKLLVDPGILEAYSNILYGTFEQPEAVSKYIVKVKSKQLNWRQFLYFSGMSIMPAHYINIKGSEYLEKFQFNIIPGSGPYYVMQEDIRKGESVLIRRRSDYWSENERFNKGL
jgi:microcin C transport system substrate-binding protein